MTTSLKSRPARTIGLALAAAALATAGSARAATFYGVQDSFNGDLSAWDVVGNVDIRTGYDYGEVFPAKGLNRFAVFGSDNYDGPGGLTLTANTVVGQLYQITFNYRAYGAGSQVLSVAPLGQNEGPPNNYYADPYFTADAAGTWHEGYRRIRATGTTTLFDLLADAKAGDGIDIAVDKIGISAVPEPGTWAMLMVGFGLTGAAIRRSLRAFGRPAEAAV